MQTILDFFSCAFEHIEQHLNKLENAGNDLNKGKNRKTILERNYDIIYLLLHPD